MNFPGPINASLSSASAVSLDGEQFAFGAHSHSVGGHQGAAGIVIPDKHLLFHGDYAREGNDLILSAPDQKYVVHDYFKGEKRPALISEDGAMLSGHIVSSLTGHVQYAQATAPDAAAQVIGHVMKLTGSASVIRNGVTVELNVGDAVQKGDVVQTGSDSTIAMTLIDGSAFGMTSNARMVLNEMVYDPSGSSNSSFISLVQGTVTFVAGQTAKNGNMRVETPVATMGIRGTAVAVKIYSETGVVETVLGIEPDGHTGGFAYYDNTTGELLGTVTQAGRVTIISPGGVGQPATATEQQLSPQAALADKTLFNLVYQLAFPNFNPDANPKSTDHPRTDIGVPPTIIGKAGTDADGRATITYTIQVTNPITHVTTDVQVIAVNTPPSFAVQDVTDAQAIVVGAHSFKLGDRVTITDRDIGAAPFFDVAVPYTPLSGHYVATGPSSINFGSYLFNSNLLTFDAQTGLVTYNPEGFRFLDDGETAVYTFTFLASSGVGSSGSDSANLTLTLTVTGQNDAPTIVPALTVATNGVKEDVGAVAGNIKTSGLITFQDFDLTDAHTASFVPTSTSISTPLPGFNPSTMSLGTFALLPVSENLTDTNDTGSVGWTFELNDNNSILQSLAEGQKITQTYTITITDNDGVSVDQLVTVTITGTNDAPILAADTVTNHQAAEVTNTTGAASTVVDSTFGYLAFTDVDLTDTHQATVALDTGANAVVWSGGAYSGIPSATIAALGAAITAAIGTGALNPDSTGTGAGAVKWDFSLPDSLFDFLGHSETLTLVYDVTVTDYNNGVATGTSSTQQVTVQITASNDKPVITVVDVSGTVQEDTIVPVNKLHDTGSVTFADADETDHETASVVFVSDTHSAGATISPALHTALQSALTLQQSSYSSSAGTVNWDFNLDNGLAQYLAANETVTATYTISVKDNSGVAANDTSVPKTVTVTITGTNDAPVVSGTVSDVSAVEDSTSSVLNALANASDVDEGSSLSVVNIPGVLPAGVTYDSGSHNFTLDPGNAAYQHLAAGQLTTVTVNYGVTDGIVATPTAAAVSWTITGTNDAPIVSAATLTAVAEDTSAPAGDTIANLFPSGTKFTDVDDGATLKGIAITGYTADNAKGDWQYNDGSGWNSIGSVSASLALVLSATTSLRFLPAQDFNGPAPSLTVYGIDDTFTGPFTAGTVHQVQDLSATTSHGNQTPFSATATTISTSINPVNDAPVATGTATLAPIDEDTLVPPAATVSSLFSANFSDAKDAVAGGSSANTFAGIAITGYTPDAAKGDWQYSVDSGGNWIALGPVTFATALTLGSSDLLRFAPTHDYNGAATALNANLIESGEVFTRGATITLSAVGGTTHFSQDQVTLGETIIAVNDAPVAVTDPITNDTPPSAAGWVLNPDNGHYYRYVADVGVNWIDANAAAVSDHAYLASITSAPEQSFVSALLASGQHYSWLGGYGPVATDTASWYWASGPEQGTHFTYTNWNAGEPNGFPGFTDAGLSINSDGTWNDIFTTDTDHFVGYGYVEEWGGQAGQVVFREDTGTTLTTQQLLANDTDVDTPHASLSITGVSASSAHGGTAALDGNIITYHAAANYNGADSFTYTLSDGSLTSIGTVSFNVDAVNDAPVLDLNSGDAPGTTGYAANLSNDGNAFPIAAMPTVTDVDNTTMASATVVLTDGQSGDFFYVPESSPGSGTLPNGIAWSISGVAGSPNPLTVTFSGAYSNADYADAIQQVSFGTTGAAGDRHIEVAVSDGADNSNIATATINVQDAGGGNTAPNIDQGPETASVFAVGATFVADQFTATDPDTMDTQTWTVDGGTRVTPDTYHFAIDEFKVERSVSGNPSNSFVDTFDGTAPPTTPASNPDGLTYRVTQYGSFVNQNGEALIDSATAGFVGLNMFYGTPTYGQFATLVTDTTPGGTDGLRPGDDFNVSGLFDLVVPDANTESYGIRLTDRISVTNAQSQPGNDVIELGVVRGPGGTASVQLMKLDYVTGIVTTLQTIPVGAFSPGEQIRLQLSNAAYGEVSASFSLEHAGIVDSTVNFTASAEIFHGEDWTLAQFFGRSTAVSSAGPDADSALAGTYGTFVVDQNGMWGYSLNAALPSTHALAANETAHDIFTVRVTDAAGASDFKTVDVTVTGANDAPVLNAPIIVTANQNSSNVSVLLGSEGGRLLPDSSYASGDTDAYRVALGDVNGDGKLDIVVSNHSYPSGGNTVGVLLGDGNGGFGSATTFATGGSQPNGVKLGDVNGDGNPDIVVSNLTSDNVGVLLGNGLGGFGPATNFSAGGSFAFDVALGDMDNDGKLDIVVSEELNNSVGVMLGDGHGGFAPASTFGSGGEHPTQLAIGDFNGDGNLDVAVANIGNPSNVNVGILLGDGLGGLTLSGTYNSGGQPGGLAVGDVNGDGKLDIVAANSSNNTVGVLLGDGNGGFMNAGVYFSGGSGASEVALRDMNGDGLLDIVVDNSVSNNVGVLLNNGFGGFSPAMTFATGGSGATGLAVGSLSAAPMLNSIADDDVNSSGQTVGSFLSGVRDVDHGALQGIAVTATNDGNGAWEYSLNGSNWFSLTASLSSALLLTTDDYIRFVPNGVSATTASLTYHAWDRTQGTEGGIWNLADGTGGSTAFSIGTQTAVITAFDINPIVETVQTNAGYDTSTLWTDLSAGTLDSYDASHVTLINGNHTITVDAVGLTWNNVPGGIELTGGVINAVHITDSTSSDPLLDLTNLNTFATDFYAAVGPSGTQAAFNGLFSTRVFDIHGGFGPDVLIGHNLNDQIDTGGGADIVNAGAGNDVIIVHDNSGWQIDGGSGVDTLRLAGAVTLADAPVNQSVANIEIIDLNKTAMTPDTVNIDPEGAYQINSTHIVRVLGGSDDVVNLKNDYNGHPGGHWDAPVTGVSFSGDNFTSGVTFDKYIYEDTTGTLATLYVEQGVVVNHAPVIDSDSFEMSQVGNTTTISGITVSDVDSSLTETYTASAVAGSGATLTPAGGSGHLSQINDAFATGVTYDPGLSPPANDTVTVTVADGFGAKDTVNFIFNQAGTGPVTLNGTEGKDVIFATGYQDTLTGGGGRDQFVFAETNGGPGTVQDTIMDFQQGQDKIDLHLQPSFDAAAIASLLANADHSGNDTLLHLDANTDILVKNVAALTANDFIIHPGGGFA